MSRGPGPYAVTIERGLGEEARERLRGFIAAAEAEGALAPGSVAAWSGDFAALARVAEGGEIAGAILFAQPEARGEIFLLFAYVAPGHRRRGLFARLHTTLVLHAQCVGAAGLRGQTAPLAGPINRALRRAGYEIAAVEHRLALGEVE